MIITGSRLCRFGESVGLEAILCVLTLNSSARGCSHVGEKGRPISKQILLCLTFCLIERVRKEEVVASLAVGTLVKLPVLRMGGPGLSTWLQLSRSPSCQYRLDEMAQCFKGLVLLPTRETCFEFPDPSFSPLGIWVVNQQLRAFYLFLCFIRHSFF